ncbi:MAG: polyamine aminopropyltransferase [Gammaproteobacteria bacterium]|nr:MAG: polyamine aminopropyltransferase [Gammaproteobacteria bacterium]
MSLNNDWFTEAAAEEGCAFSLRIREKLYSEQTPYQLLEIYQTETFGKLMTLDGLVMLTDRDNFIYHEMMTHPALFCHPDPKRILIIGGGDCGSLRETLKHDSVTQVDQVELDEQVTLVSEKYFPDLCQSNDDPRAHFYFEDGIQWVARSKPDSYDIIIIDSTDPVGPAEGLFSTEFYRDCLDALDANGILIAQSESPLLHAGLIKNMRSAMVGVGFQEVVTLLFPQCSYPSGWWSSTLACKNGTLSEYRQQDINHKSFDTKYYNPDIHDSAQKLPEFLIDLLE